MVYKNELVEKFMKPELISANSALVLSVFCHRFGYAVEYGSRTYVPGSVVRVASYSIFSLMSESLFYHFDTTTFLSVKKSTVSI